MAALAVAFVCCAGLAAARAELADEAPVDAPPCCLAERAAHGEAKAARDVAKQHHQDLKTIAATARDAMTAAERVVGVAERRLVVCLERLSSERDRATQRAVEHQCRKHQQDVLGAQGAVPERKAELDSVTPRLDAAHVALERAEQRLAKARDAYAACAKKCAPGTVDEEIVGADATRAAGAAASAAGSVAGAGQGGGAAPGAASARRFLFDHKLGASFGLGARPHQLAFVVAPALALAGGGAFAVALPLQLLAAPSRATFAAPLALQYELPLARGFALSLRVGGGYFWEQGAAGFDRGPAVLAEAGLVYAPRRGVRVGFEPASTLVLFGKSTAAMLRLFAFVGLDL